MATSDASPVPSPDQPEPRSLRTRVPGRARPRAEAMTEFEEGVADLRRRLDPALWPLFIPKAEDVFRWRIQLECGCVREIFTTGKDRFPDERSDRDPVTGCRLPDGEFWCRDHHVAKPYREIAEWDERRVHEFPADPEEPQHGLDAETWAKIQRPEPHSSAFWRVKLSCGHYADVCVGDLDWKPEDGPRLVTKKRLAEIRRDFEEMWASGEPGWPNEGPERDHIRRMLDLGWPRPEPEHECFACTAAKRVTGYQRIGPLVPPPKPAAPPPTERERVEAQLARAEAEVQRLRKRLEQAQG